MTAALDVRGRRRVSSSFEPSSAAGRLARTPTPDQGSNESELNTVTTFRELGVLPEICDALDRVNIVEPFPIQEMTLPVALMGTDLIGQARTGTGKTLGFGIPLLQRTISPGEADYEDGGAVGRPGVDGANHRVQQHQGEHPGPHGHADGVRRRPAPHRYVRRQQPPGQHGCQGQGFQIEAEAGDQLRTEALACPHIAEGFKDLDGLGQDFKRRGRPDPPPRSRP